MLEIQQMEKYRVATIVTGYKRQLFSQRLLLLLLLLRGEGDTPPAPRLMTSPRATLSVCSAGGGRHKKTFQKTFRFRWVIMKVFRPILTFAAVAMTAAYVPPHMELPAGWTDVSAATVRWKRLTLIIVKEIILRVAPDDFVCRRSSFHLNSGPRQQLH